MIDDITDTAADESFRITDDSTADWAIKKITEERAELQRLQSLANEEIASIAARLEQAKKSCDSGTSYLLTRLREYFDAVPHRTTKTQAKYRLLSGDLVLKKGSVKTAIDDAQLVPWLEGMGRLDLVRVKKAAAWSDIKSLAEITPSGAVFKETGEMLPGVTCEQQPDTFDIVPVKGD